MKEITLMDAYLIEILRSEGLKKDDIIKYVSEKRVDELQKYHDNFDFNGLYDIEDLERVLQDGYKIKFLTMPGLVNLLRMKYGKQPEKDFTQLETSIEKLQLTATQKADLQQWLAANWQIVESGGTIAIVPRYT